MNSRTGQVMFNLSIAVVITLTSMHTGNWTFTSGIIVGWCVAFATIVLVSQEVKT